MHTTKKSNMLRWQTHWLLSFWDIKCTNLNFVLQDKRADSYRYAVTPGGDDGKKKKSKKQKKKENLDELKQELEMDEHKVPIEELYERLGTNPDTVCINGICSIHILKVVQVHLYIVNVLKYYYMWFFVSHIDLIKYCQVLTLTY